MACAFKAASLNMKDYEENIRRIFPIYKKG